MTKENTEEIMAVDPIFYRERGMDCQQTCMCWGLECGDGWKKPLLELAGKTKVLNGVLNPLGLCIVGKQVKSKWADLRVYWDMMPIDNGEFRDLSDEEQSVVDSVNRLMDDAVSAAEAECEWTCETCGYKGSEWANDIVTCGSWLTHYCLPCAQKRQREAGVVTDYRHGFDFLNPFEKGEIRTSDGRRYGCFLGMYYCLLRPQWSEVFKSLTNPKEVQDAAVGMGLACDEDWALEPMRMALEIKFGDDRLARMLLDTDGLELAGMNHCHENWWGGCVCENCKDVPHLNHYGKLLMELRDRIKEGMK